MNDEMNNYTNPELNNSVPQNGAETGAAGNTGTPAENSGFYHYNAQQQPAGGETYTPGPQQSGYGAGPQSYGNYIRPDFTAGTGAGGTTPPQQPTGNTGSEYRGYVPNGNYGNGGNGKNGKNGKKSRAGIIALVVAGCIVLGGLIGGGVAAAVLSSRNDASEAVMEEREETAIEKSTIEVGGDAEDTTAEKDTAAEEAAAEDENQQAFEKTTIHVNTNAVTNALTPQDVYENYVNAVVAISNEGTTTNMFGQTSTTASSGSGMIISEDGYILTNNHVVEDAQKLTVIMTNGEEYEATVIGADSENDVALIKIDATGLPTVSVGDSDSISVGQQVCAIGNPLGELTNTLTVGYVSALDREIYESLAGGYINMFQTDCAINSGNSGGPIFDMSGNVVGITTAKYSNNSSSSASIEGIGFCIPINDAMDIVDDFLTYGYVRGRATLGITCQTISSTVTQYYNLPVGVYVNGVTQGSGAEAAGLQQGDIICSLDGTATESVSDLKVQLKNYNPGDTVKLEVYREGETITVEVTLSESIVNANASTESSQDQSGSDDQSEGQQVNPFSGSGSGNGFGFSYGFGN